MIKNKKYILAFIEVLAFAKANKRLSNEDGERIAGSLWVNIKKELRDSSVLFLEYGNEVTLLSTEKVENKLNEAKMELEHICEKEYDRELDNKNKKDTSRLAKWSIAISILAATGLPQTIFQWLFEYIKRCFCNIIE